ncbi:DUF1684 domain-containing protein [Dyadobacter chenwenxiniae]|uniref:DUF1684 domain-containing protein n=1 Tax=Dyadobacter chenwenxiniae TaxID=2906456 RepID=A0A9X1TMM0_9BACT|nr:DUF1684 domain-containing protein [Dyadobacter chenwenxiniae]MCF0063673.1 DUF1684 domain-containing protein [Dyadobacter chenwenxiniae]UON83349.1 DUF1684 domain-containing protein [Dyadobacter chenwenxiniae]
MKSVLNTLGLLLITVSVACAQDFKKETDKYRKKYKEEFLSSANSPLKQADLPFLQFYEPDSAYRVVAKFEKSRGQSFEMPTYSGVNKTYVKYGKVKFRINGRKQTLNVYRSLSLQQLAKYKDYLFIPFKDKTNGEESYGGGRYLDLKTTDIKDGELVLDFNKAYNPYCAYSDGYNCPIPPAPNHLPIAITAGEKKFGKDHQQAELK